MDKNQNDAISRLEKKEIRTKKGVIRVIALAVCAIIIIGAITFHLIGSKEDASLTLPIACTIPPSFTPHYYGVDYSIGGGGGGGGASGLSVTARLVEMLPDVYTFFDEWDQNEFRLLKMEKIKQLNGVEVPSEFYYAVPLDFVADFSLYDCFVILDMSQFTYEYSVMYNQTQASLEQLSQVVFGYSSYGYYYMGENFMAFDAEGYFAYDLWMYNDDWKEQTKYGPFPENLAQAEELALKYGQSHAYTHLLKDIIGDAADVLMQIRNFESGIFIPRFSPSLLAYSPEVQFHADRYINGFATNERLSVWGKEWRNAEEDIFEYTKARFTEEDLSKLPDLTSATSTVYDALSNAKITAPHYHGTEELSHTATGVFGWYAKSENGVLGIVRVTWRFMRKAGWDYYDDAYFVITYGSDECRQIPRDELLELLGEYESTYVYDGEYNEYGKILDGTIVD